jgi:mannonate dehydratase
MRATVRLLDTVRRRCGDEVELLHDIHEIVPPAQAVTLCKQLEPYDLFFIEDPLAAEDLGHFEILRQHCSTPIAMGEKFHSPHEWVPLISNRQIDFIRVHVSLAGGLNVARKIAALGECFAVKTAWHGPPDVSPVGHAANVALDLACHNFGIQECTRFDEQTFEVFPGAPEVRDGYLWASEAPGWGIEVNEELAARYPLTSEVQAEYGNMRRLDGSVMRF